MRSLFLMCRELYFARRAKKILLRFGDGAYSNYLQGLPRCRSESEAQFLVPAFIYAIDHGEPVVYWDFLVRQIVGASDKKKMVFFIVQFCLEKGGMEKAVSFRDRLYSQQLPDKLRDQLLQHTKEALDQYR